MKAVVMAAKKPKTAAKAKAKTKVPAKKGFVPFAMYTKKASG